MRLTTKHTKHTKAYKAMARIYFVCSVCFVVNVFDQQVQAERPNVLWLSTEDMSPHLGCYGDEHARTPNIDELAAQGVLFKNAFVPAPVCAVCRSSIITG